MWNLKTQIRLSLSTPLTSIPLELWSIGKLKTLFTPNASEIVVIFFLWSSLLKSFLDSLAGQRLEYTICVSILLLYFQ